MPTRVYRTPYKKDLTRFGKKERKIFIFKITFCFSSLTTKLKHGCFIVGTVLSSRKEFRSCHCGSVGTPFLHPGVSPTSERRMWWIGHSSGLGSPGLVTEAHRSLRGHHRLGHQHLGHHHLGHQHLGHQHLGHQLLGHQHLGHHRRSAGMNAADEVELFGCTPLWHSNLVTFNPSMPLCRPGYDTYTYVTYIVSHPTRPVYDVLQAESPYTGIIRRAHVFGGVCRCSITSKALNGRSIDVLERSRRVWWLEEIVLVMLCDYWANSKDIMIFTLMHYVRERVRTHVFMCVCYECEWLHIGERLLSAADTVLEGRSDIHCAYMCSEIACKL